MSLVDHLEPLQTPESVRDNGFEFVYDPVEHGQIGAVAFAGYFSEGQIPIATPSNKVMHYHDMLHFPYYVRLFSIADLSVTVRSGAINSGKDGDKCVKFSTALDDVGDNLAFLDEWNDTLAITPTTLYRLNVLCGFASGVEDPITCLTQLNEALKLLEQLGFTEMSDMEYDELKQIMAEQAKDFTSKLERASANIS